MTQEQKKNKIIMIILLEDSIYDRLEYYLKVVMDLL